MANYCCTTRTNYFHVKDEAQFRSFMSHVCGREDAVMLWEEQDEHGETVFGFGCYGGIAGVRNSSDDEDDWIETAYDEFLEGLQKNVVENDAVIILEVGNEKLRYLVGSAQIITKDNLEYMDIEDLAEKRAAELLGNPSWKTELTY